MQNAIALRDDVSASTDLESNTWRSSCGRVGVMWKHTVPIATFAGALYLLLAPAVAFAASPADAPQHHAPSARRHRPESVQRTWYGYQLAAADAVWITAALTMDEPLFLIAYPFTGVLTHALHGRPEAAIGSVVLRLLLPVGLAAAGLDAAIYGSAAAVSVDIAALSWETTSNQQTTLVPLLSADRQLAGLAIRGGF